jgi:hypothetical protein
MDTTQSVEYVVFDGGIPHHTRISQHKPNDSNFKKKEILYIWKSPDA